MTDTRSPKPPTEFREALVAAVNFSQRLVELIVVPYGEEAIVEYRGEMWRETSLRGAFDGVEKRPGRIRANRGHDKARTVGKAVALWPSRDEGLVAEIRIAPTSLGEETLVLADEDMLSAS